MSKTKILTFSLFALFCTTSASNAEVVLLQPSDFVGITFWVASLGMAAATVFFFMERGAVSISWKTPLTVAGVITGVAFLHYMYMRNVWVQTGDAPTIYRYADWIITFPLQIIEFYLILSAVRKIPTYIFWRLLAATLVMLIAWYMGEARHIQSFIAFIIGIAGWLYILFEIFSGDTFKIASRIGNNATKKAFGIMRMIVTIGWAVYPLCYIFGFLTKGLDSSTLNVIYNLIDFVNRIGFGIVIWIAATNNTRRY